MSIPRVRIAPSPTGNLHVGTARAALFNYLYAKKYGGVFVLRIEDTDLERSDKKYEKGIFEDLRWLGIEPDEGPEQGGPYAPYRQTERTHTYKKYLEKLLSEGKAFYCFHSQRELEEEKEQLLTAKRPPLHMCEYRTMDPQEAAMLTGTKPDYIIRFKTPAGRDIVFHDLIRGDVSFSSDLLGDFSIARKLNSALYHFAVVADDIDMHITHVIRGEDHIPNTPKHILLFEALGFPAPQFAHLPLTLGPDRSKLSKRHGTTSIDEYRKAGYLPEALFNFITLLGWNPADNREIMSKEEIFEAFSLEKMQKSGAIFDITKLDWMNGEYIRRKSVSDLTDLCRPFLIDHFGITAVRSKKPSYLNEVIALEQPRLKKLSEIGERADYFFREPEYDKELLRWKQMTDEGIAVSLEKSERILSAAKNRMHTLKTEMERTHAFMVENERMVAEPMFFDEIGTGDKGALLWPLRVALSGKKASPGPFEIMEILGTEESLKRIRAAQEKLRSHV